MDLTIVVALMLVLPATGFIVESLMSQAAFTRVLVGKWFVFWVVSVRLAIAGWQQIPQTRYTAEVILALKSQDSLVLVRGLGFAHLLIGLLELTSLALPSWSSAAALAGIHRTFRGDRNEKETIAMASDLWAAVVLLSSLSLKLISSPPPEQQTTGLQQICSVTIHREICA
ncbi:hypothetical protein [Cyanobium gracile]|uniref:Uncharacterized protein n=1 Tax=Cyanobium gracile UHCC 0281 TaxID=3110309 RepID=A0ABU5SVI8_9CYAN|nr:hypothetical protein [Cyanobium gracile]MEA5442539.1 hypothetical protein [Cyanobium gracile UHCC 0281]